MSNARMTTREFHATQAKPKRRTIADAAAHRLAGASKPPKTGKGKAKAVKVFTARLIEQMAQPGEAVFVLALPPKQASPNGRGHWGRKARAVAAYRDECAQVMGAFPSLQFSERVEIDLEFYLCRIPHDNFSYYPKDEDNARGSMKAAQDALKDAGIIPGDGKKFVRMGKTTLYTRAKEHKGFTCVVMTIRKEED